MLFYSILFKGFASDSLLGLVGGTLRGLTITCRFATWLIASLDLLGWIETTVKALNIVFFVFWVASLHTISPRVFYSSLMYCGTSPGLGQRTV